MQLFALKISEIWCILVNFVSSKSDFGTCGERNLLSADDYVKPLKNAHSTTGRSSRVARKKSFWENNLDQTGSRTAGHDAPKVWCAKTGA